MAFPVILIDSATGSDSAASGAGPSTAITGSAGSTDGTGLVVTLDGSPSLAGVAVDGSHVIFINDTTAGNRNFSKITAKDDILKTVTVADAFGASLSGKTWAIGGKRASIGSTTSVKLLENNNSTSDVMPGWQVRFASGHAETVSAPSVPIQIRRAGNTIDGPITIGGDPNFTVRPLLSNANNGIFITTSDMVIIENVAMNMATNNTFSKAIVTGSTARNRINNVWIVDSGTARNYNNAITVGNGSRTEIENCKFAYCGQSTVVGSQSFNTAYLSIKNCEILNGASSAITAINSNGGLNLILKGNIIVKNQVGIRIDGLGSFFIMDGNTVDSNVMHGLEFTSNPNINQLMLVNIIDNQFTNNSGYGIAFVPTSGLTFYSQPQYRITGNNFYANVSGATLPSGLGDNNYNFNPGYISPSVGRTLSGNYYPTAQASCLSGYPFFSVGYESFNRSYNGIGLQHTESGSVSSVLFNATNWNGGFDG